jgi:hypothetical protein
MTNHDATGELVTLHTNDILSMCLVLASLRPVIAQAAPGMTEGMRAAINKAYSLVDFEADGTCRIPDGRKFVVALNPPPANTENGDK